MSGNFSLHHCVQTGSEAHSTSYPVGTVGLSPGGKADHLHPSSAKVKNMWSYTSTPQCLHGMVLSVTQGQLYLFTSREVLIEGTACKSWLTIVRFKLMQP